MKREIKILVTGNRTCVGDEWRECVRAWLVAIDEYCRRRDVSVVLIHGGQVTYKNGRKVGGADWFADEIGHELGWTVRVYKADWNAEGDAAGPLRNEHMDDEEQPDRVYAFGKLRKRPTHEKRSGTGGMVDIANERGRLIIVVSAPGLRPGI